MIKSITILKNGKVTNGPVIDEESKVMEWLKKCLDKSKFGAEGTFEVVVKDVVPDYKELRLVEYTQIDDLKNEALTEFLVENRTEKLEIYKALRQEIKSKYPKEVK